MRVSAKFLNPATPRRWRRLSTDAARQLTEQSSVISEALSVLQSTNPSSWSSDPNLGNLLSSLSPSAIFRVTRGLQSFGIALRFFDCLKADSRFSSAVPFAFKAILELSLRERYSPGKVYDLYLLAKRENTPIPLDSAALLIKCFGKVNMLDEMMEVFDEIDEGMKNTDVVNLVLLGLLEWGRVDNALEVLDEMLQRDSRYPPNRNTAGVVFSSILGRSRRGRNVKDEELHNLFSRFEEHGVSPDGFLLTKIVARFCRNSEHDRAWSVLHAAMKTGSAMEVASCNVLLTGLGQSSDFTRMNQLLKAMQDNGIKPNVVTYGIMVKHLCSFRRVDEALELVEKKMRDSHVGIKPDVVIFNTLIDGFCKVGRQEEGLKLMERMKCDYSYKPNTITYNCLIGGFCKAGEFQKAHELVDQMGKEGVEQNIITSNTLLDGLCKQGRVGTAMELLNSLKQKGFKGNAVTYSILITAFCNVNNIDKALKLFDEMREGGCSPDPIVYYSLISGLCSAGRTDDITSVVFKLKEAGFSLDIVTYNTLVAAFCRKNNVDKACEVLKDMQQAGVKPDQVTYNTLLSCCCSKGDFTSANRLMNRMRDDGLKPSVVTYGTLIQLYCTNGDLGSAMKIFRDMSSKSSSCPPNTAIYNMLIDAQCKNDGVEAAVSLMKEMKERGVRPNAITYNALFKGLQKENSYKKAIEFMDQMTEEACHPDSVTMDILTVWLCAVGEYDKLREFVEGFKTYDRFVGNL